MGKLAPARKPEDEAKIKEDFRMVITRINNNITALNATRNLNRSSFALAKSLERLSSGLRINRAADELLTRRSCPPARVRLPQHARGLRDP